MKFKIFKFENVTSTNDVAIHLIRIKQKKTGCVYADEQTKGRGTYGKQWISNKGNFFASVFFPLKKNYPAFDEFSVINPIIISDVIKRLCKKINIKIKFPNDIFLNGKKVCGILQEHIVVNGKKFLIVGIGINMISNPDIRNSYKATIVLLETKKKPSINHVISLIIASYEKFFVDIDSYNYVSFKKKADSMILNLK